jgi:predicted transposase/invertase (TIGR01784 family)
MPKPEINLKNPHDSFFKKLFDNEENVRDFLEAYLPKELSKNIDFNSVKIIDTEKENKKHKKYFLDLSVECNIGKTKSKVYIVFEHKSYYDKLTLMQILNYCLTIWESEIENKQEFLTPIVPFVFYHGKQKSKLKHNFHEYFEANEALDGYLMDFKFVIFDTTEIENNDIIKSINNLYLSASLLLMKNIFKDVRKLKPILKEIITLEDDRVIRLFEYIVVNNDLQEEEFIEMVKDIKGDDKMSSLAQRWVDQGISQGIETGIQQGVFETAIRMIDRFNLSVDDVIKELNIKKEELLEYMKKSKEEEA